MASRMMAAPLRLVAASALGFCIAGCTLLLDVDALLSRDAAEIDRTVTEIQTQDPRTADLPEAAARRGDVVTLHPNVNVVVVVQQDLEADELPDITLLGFENLTGFDVFIRYLVDGEFQGVFVFGGQTLLLEYPCLGAVELLSEDDFDPLTGVFVGAFDLSEAVFLNGQDFFCGDAFIITIDPDAVIGTPELIDLLP